MLFSVIEPAQLAHLEYIADDSGMSAPSSAKESTREEGGAAAKKEDRPPIGVTLKYDSHLSKGPFILKKRERENLFWSSLSPSVEWEPIRKQCRLPFLSM